MVALFTACSSPAGIASVDSGGAAGSNPGSAGATQNDASGSGGTENSGGTTSDPGGGAAGSAETTGGENQGGGGSGGTAAEVGGTGTVGGAGTGGDPVAGAGGALVASDCVFHTDAPAPDEGGIGGTGGAGGASGAGGAGPAPLVTLQLSVFVGSYLGDTTGRTLYTYGGDLPGDCNTPPVSQCTADCALSWPPFDAGARTVATGLDDQGFGSIVRSDGLSQTTYYGWPLYFYKTDLTLGQVSGQGKGKTWHIAQKTPASVVIMKLGTVKYLADSEGHTLYVSAADQAGTASADPVSNCSGACLDGFSAFHERNLSVVTSLAESDFSVFARHGAGGLQTAYKGLPLYLATTDHKSSDMTGTTVTGFSAALQ